MKRWIQVGTGLFVLVVLLLQGAQGLASPMSRLPGQNQAPPPAWQEAIERIDQALESGEITLEQAVRLRLQALREPFALPEDYRPLRPPEAYPHRQSREALPEVAAMFWALFRDRDRWPAETRAFIEDEFQRMTAAEEAQRSASETFETEHFRIRWDPDQVPNGQDYADLLGSYLEEAWGRSSDTGYALPHPGEYYTFPGISFSHRIEVEIRPEIVVCGLPLERAAAMSVPLHIFFDASFLSASPSPFEQALAAHELFHVI